MRDIPRDIIEAAANGDVSAFEEIYRNFSSAVYTLALGVTQDRQDAEEAAQDVFIKVFRNLKKFGFRSSLWTWIYRITMNTAMNFYNRRARQISRFSSYEETGEDATPAAEGGPGKDAAKSEAAEHVAAILKTLNPEQRACLVLREIEGLDYRQIADALAIPLNTVRSRLKRAREAAAAYCRKEGLCHGVS